MSLIIGSPYKGREWHIYEADGDDRSLCGRATNVRGQTSFDIEKVSCIKCKRAYEILSRNAVPQVPAGISGTPSGVTPNKLRGTKRTRTAPSSSSSIGRPKKNTTKSKQRSSVTKTGKVAKGVSSARKATRR